MRRALLALAAAALLSPAAFPLVSADEGGEPPSTDASKSGEAVFRLLGVLVNAEGGKGSQTVSVTGPHGDTKCKCADFRWGVCHSWEGEGYFLVTWSRSQWKGDGSALAFSGSVTRTFPYAANNGFESPCNATLNAQVSLTRAVAGAMTSSFASLRPGSTSGYTEPGTEIPLGPPLHAPAPIYTSGTGTWSGDDVSWRFSYTGNARIAGVTACTNCLTAYGQSVV